jgi:hypothetical protein
MFCDRFVSVHCCITVYFSAIIVLSYVCQSVSVCISMFWKSLICLRSIFVGALNPTRVSEHPH